MKKIMRSTFGRLFNKNWMLAAILICGASVLASCSNSDDPVVTTKKCARVAVKYWLKTAKENNTFFVGKYATWSGDIKEDPTAIIGIETNGDYSNKVSTFPRNEDLFIHFDVKEQESYEGDFVLKWNLEYTVTTYDADDKVLDTETFEREKDFHGTSTGKESLEMDAKLAYMEVHASIAENGDITITHKSKDSGDSGIDW